MVAQLALIKCQSTVRGKVVFRMEKRDLQRSQTQNNSHRKLHPTLHLNIPQQNRRQDSQSPICGNLNSGEKETDIAIQFSVT